MSSIEEILQETDSESDDEGKEEDAKDKRSKVKGHKSKKLAGQRGKAWLKEGDQDEDAPLDFLDPSVSKRVLGKNDELKKLFHPSTF